MRLQQHEGRKKPAGFHIFSFFSIYDSPLSYMPYKVKRVKERNLWG